MVNPTFRADKRNHSVTVNKATNLEELLPKKVFLYKKCVVTTDDAVVIRTSDETAKDAYHYAFRLIHHDMKTDKPFILLHTSDDIDEAERLVEEMHTTELDAEFPNRADCYVAHINYCGAMDDRIQWYIV